MTLASEMLRDVRRRLRVWQLAALALALLLCDNGHAVSLWSHNPEKAEAMQKTRENPLLSGVSLPEELEIVSDTALTAEADLVVFATPSFALRETARRAAPYLRPEQTLVSVTKGIERDTNLRMSEVLRQETGDICQVVSLSGPSHAEEVGRRLPTGCVAACPDERSACLVQDAFMNGVFRVYTSPDIVGVELSAALKNIIALGCGISDGMGYQDNTKALIMTRAMAEIARLTPEIDWENNDEFYPTDLRGAITVFGRTKRERPVCITFTESGHDLQFDSGQIHNSFSLKVLKDIGGTNNIMESVGDGEPLLHYIRQRMLFLEQHPEMGK